MGNDYYVTGNGRLAKRRAGEMEPENGTGRGRAGLNDGPSNQAGTENRGRRGRSGVGLGDAIDAAHLGPTHLGAPPHDRSFSITALTLLCQLPSPYRQQRED